MNILIPMAGAGSRFSKQGYHLSKPLIPTYSLKLQKTVPMVIAATLDIPRAQQEFGKVIYIDRDFHQKEGIEAEIKDHIPEAEFITIDYLTAGQAATCLLAKDLIDNGQELFIGCCDNGMIIDQSKFEQVKKMADAIILTHSNDRNIEHNPLAHSWVLLDDDQKTVQKMSIKKPVSDNPMQDHATTGMFWFKRGSDFVKAAELMINRKDQTGGEYYVDQVMQYIVNLGLKTMIFDIQYLCWGTPHDYENYQDTVKYWQEFLKKEKGSNDKTFNRDSLL